MALKTQGSELYFIDPNASDFPVVRLECPTGITGFGGQADQIDTTCLEDINSRSEPGIFRSGPVTVPFVLRGASEVHAGQEAMIALRDSRLTTGWFAGLSDGTALPTKDSDNANLVRPSGRSGFTFRGYVSDLTFDIGGNEVVRGTLLIQMDGGFTFGWSA